MNHPSDADRWLAITAAMEAVTGACLTWCGDRWSLLRPGRQIVEGVGVRGLYEAMNKEDER